MTEVEIPCALGACRNSGAGRDQARLPPSPGAETRCLTPLPAVQLLPTDTVSLGDLWLPLISTREPRDVYAILSHISQLQSGSNQVQLSLVATSKGI